MVISKNFIAVWVIFLSCILNAVAEPRPLNIVFVVEYFPAPSQTYVLNIITGLIDKGHNVSIFAFHENDAIGQPIQPNVEKYSLMDHVTYGKWPKELPDYDIIFCQSATLGNKILKISALTEWLKTRKLAIALRGADIAKHAVKNNPKNYKQLFAQADVFLPVCEYFKEVAINVGCNPDKIIVYHSAIDCSQFFFREREVAPTEIVQLVSVCRLIEKKGTDVAIRAIARVAKNCPNVHFTVVGQGPLEDSLKQLVKKLNVSDKVTFFGWGTQDDVVKVLDKSHIFLLPSTTALNGDKEGIPNALKEAMAMGLVVVATRHAGNPELIDDGVSGFLVPEKNSKELARKIKYLIRNPEIWKSVALAARKKIEDEFETKKSIEELERIFYGLLDV